jgi:hypothetical protein
MKTITAVGLAALAILSPAKAMARGQSNFQDHVRLAQAAEATGVRVAINVDRCDTEDAYGWYWAAANELVVCQENKIKGSNKEVRWTEEDLDTLRHEAHHLVQDCMARDNRDGLLGSVYQEPVQLGFKVLGRDRAIRIAELYAENGANEHIQIMEIEAFAVAEMNDPTEQIQDIQRYCM